MKNKLAILLFLISMVLISCIEEFYPVIDTGETQKYVVSGLLSDEKEDQVISISLASSIRDPKTIPLNDCVVRIVDTEDNSFSGEELENGIYNVRIPSEFLKTGVSYRLEIHTPSGAQLLSEFQELHECPEIDSVYFTRESIPTNDPEVFIEGIQFYMNLDARGVDNVYYKFDVEETWEYHTEMPLEFYYDGEIVHSVIPMDWSHNVCWSTRTIPEIFILNTGKLKDNAYKQYPLHFVDNTTQRLLYTYSILVRQYTISEEVYIFWDQLRLNNLEEGGLYETQPLPVQANIENLTDPDQEVLGSFAVSSVKKRRIFVTDVPDLESEYMHTCVPRLLRFGLRELTPDLYDYPVYLGDPFGFIELTPDCIFCEVFGGTTNRPEYWPDTNE